MEDFKKRGKSIVLVSHNPADVQLLCDRAIFLKDGHIDSIGKTSDVLDSYKKYMSTLEA